jgi:hypothetical protein
MSPDILGIMPFGKIIIGAFFLFYWAQAFFIVYHLVRFGVGTKPKLVALIYFAGAILLYTVVSNGISQIDFSNFSFTGIDFNFLDSLNLFEPLP